jgi:hypothetical protein
MGDPAFDERKFAVGVPICRTRVLADQSGVGAGLDVMRLPDGRLVQCVPAEYVYSPAQFQILQHTNLQLVFVPARTIWQGFFRFPSVSRFPSVLFRFDSRSMKVATQENRVWT